MRTDNAAISWLPFFIAICLASLAVSAHITAIHNSFSGLDDSLYVYENRRVLSGISWESLKWAFSLGTNTYWHPATWLSLMLDTQFFGSAPWGYHLTNVILHACNAVLFFFLLFVPTRQLWPSAAAAAIFSVHPIHVESVAWITARKDVLSTFFFLLSALTHVLWSRTGALRCRVLSVAAYALAVLAKPAALTLPFALLLLDAWPLQRLSPEFRRNIPGVLKEKLPYFLILCLALLMVLLSHPLAGTSGDTGNVPFFLRLANIPLAYVIYIKKLFLPTDLAVLYSFPTSIPVWKSLGALAALACITVITISKWKSFPALPIGWLFFLGTMFPMIGLVQAGLWPALADRYAYLPFLGLDMAIAFGLSSISAKQIPRPLLAIGLATILAVLFPATQAQIRLWDSTEALFRQATVNVRDNWMAFALLGKSLSAQNRLEEAELAYRKAIALNPQHGAAYSGLGATLEGMGRIEEALEVHREGMRRNPNHPMGYLNLGWALERQGSYTPEAFEALEKAMRLAPTWPQPHIFLGDIYRKQKNYDTAVRQYLQALERDPEFPGSHLGLGLVFMDTRRYTEALDEFTLELPLSPNNSDLHMSIGFCLTQLNRLDDALPHLSLAVQLRPDSAPAWNNLGVLLAKMGRLDHAQQALEKALALDPDFARARASLEKVLRERQGAAAAPQ